MTTGFIILQNKIFRSPFSSKKKSNLWRNILPKVKESGLRIKRDEMTGICINDYYLFDHDYLCLAENSKQRIQALLENQDRPENTSRVVKINSKFKF